MREDAPPLVVILCGNCGAGKSSTANTLLGRHHFASQRSASAVTMECLSAPVNSDGRTIHVLDTPGLSDPESSEAEIHAKIIASMAAMAEAHPDARFSVALVASLAGRLDETVLSAFSNLGLVFGRGLFDHATLVWTHGDLLLEDAANFGAGQLDEAALETAYEAYLATAGETLTTWLSNIKGGSIVLSNRGDKSAGLELARFVERAWAVSGLASQLAPPKGHRKLRRRQRQQEMLRDRHHYEARAEYDESAGPAPRGVFAFSRLFDCICSTEIREPPILFVGGSRRRAAEEDDGGQLELLERGGGGQKHL